VKLHDGIRETFDWYVANGYIDAALQWNGYFRAAYLR
jgi:hypothetical protein